MEHDLVLCLSLARQDPPRRGGRRPQVAARLPAQLGSRLQVAGLPSFLGPLGQTPVIDPVDLARAAGSVQGAVRLVSPDLTDFLDPLFPVCLCRFPRPPPLGVLPVVPLEPLARAAVDPVIFPLADD